MTRSGCGLSEAMATRDLFLLASSILLMQFRNNVRNIFKALILYDNILFPEHMNMNLGSSNGMSANSGGSIAPPPPPPLSSSGGGSGPSSLSPGTIGGYNSLQPGPQPQPGGQGGQPPQGYGGGGGGGVPPPLSSSQSQSPADFRYSGTELVMLYDYKVCSILIKIFLKTMLAKITFLRFCILQL